MKHKLFTLLNEQFQMYEIQILIKCNQEFNITEIYNQIRGIEDVIVLTVIDNDKVKIKNNDKHHYSLLRIKFDATDTKQDLIKLNHKIKNIRGVLNTHPRVQTLNKIRNY